MTGWTPERHAEVQARTARLRRHGYVGESYLVLVDDALREIERLGKEIAVWQKASSENNTYTNKQVERAENWKQRAEAAEEDAEALEKEIEAWREGGKENKAYTDRQIKRAETAEQRVKELEATLDEYVGTAPYKAILTLQKRIEKAVEKIYRRSLRHDGDDEVIAILKGGSDG